MTRKFILHIGPAKTGTSSLQETLFEHREQLLGHGFDFPVFGRHQKMPQLPGHHGLPVLLRQQPGLPDEMLETLVQIPDDRTVIFSSENLADIDGSQVRGLMASLQPDEIQVVYYARSWGQLLPSVWQELVKHGEKRPYLEFLNRQISAPMATHYLNYMIVLDRWAQVVGKQNIRIFSYDNIRAAGQDIVQHFCAEVLKIPNETVASRQDNPRQPPGRTETVRQLNNLYFKTKPPGPQVRHRLDQHQETVTAELAALEEIYQPYMAKAPICAPFVFANIERQFLKLYGTRVENLSEDGRLFQNNSVQTAPYVRQDYLMEPGVPELFRSLLSKLGL